MRRESLGRVLLLLFGLAAGLVLAELGLRLVDEEATPYTGMGLYQADDELGHVLRPKVTVGDIRTNSHGFRDPERPLRRPPGVFRIVGVGDSFTFGSTDPDGIYLRVLEKELRRGGRPVEVINAGVPGYSTWQELGHLRKFGLRFEPDLVLLGLFVTGDVIENHADVHLQVVAGELTGRTIGRGERFLMRFRLWRFLVTRGVVRADDRPSVHRGFLDVEKDRLRTCARKLRPDVRHGFEQTEAVLVEMRDLLRERGIPLLVLLIPDELQVNPAVFEDVLSTYHLDRADFDLDQPNRILLDLLGRAGIETVDPLPALREAQPTRTLYWPDDTHLNPAGAEVVAAALGRNLALRIPAP